MCRQPCRGPSDQWHRDHVAFGFPINLGAKFLHIQNPNLWIPAPGYKSLGLLACYLSPHMCQTSLPCLLAKLTRTRRHVPVLPHLRTIKGTWGPLHRVLYLKKASPDTLVNKERRILSKCSNQSPQSGHLIWLCKRTSKSQNFVFIPVIQWFTPVKQHAGADPLILSSSIPVSIR